MVTSSPLISRTTPTSGSEKSKAKSTSSGKHGASLLAQTFLFDQKWHATERNVSVGDVVWLCDQNALRGQFRLGRVVTVAPDSKGIVRDVEVLVTPGNCASVHHQQPVIHSTGSSDQKGRSNGVVLRRDVRRLVVLLPVEEQCP